MNKIIKKYKGLISRIWKIRAKIKVILNLFFLKGKNIFLIGWPTHSNMGDQAQTYCIEVWLKKNYPEYNMIDFYWDNRFPFSLYLLRLLRKKIGVNDLLFGHSGYFFIDHHSVLPLYCKIAQLFPEYNFIILPQTINISDKKILEQTKIALNTNHNITLLCRDDVSYKKAQNDFDNCKLILYPDIVTSLIGTMKFTFKRNGILFCIRDDIEAFYQTKEINKFRSKFNGIMPTEITDTSIDVPYWKVINHREHFLMEMLEKFAHYKLIITDRYHGTIFSLIAATPVIVLSSADHKLSSGVKWFPESFSHYVKFAKDLDEAYELAIQMLNENYEYKLPPYFQKNYYSVLKEKLQ